MHALDAGLLVNAASGMLMVALGVFVATVRGDGRANRAFALFAVPFGLTYVLDNLHLWAGHPSLAATIAVGGLLTIASVGLAAVARVYPRPLEPADRSRVAAAFAVGFLVLAMTLAFQFRGGAWDATIRGAGWEALPTAGRLSYWTGFLFFHATAWAVLVLFALRHTALADRDKRAADGLRLMSLALVLYPAFYVGRETVVFVVQDGWSVAEWLAGLAFIVVPTVGLAALWLRNASRSPMPKQARTVAWVVLTAAIIGIPSLGLEGNHPGFGLSRTIGVVLLAYAIIRHQLLGIDVKVRWTLSKGTVAAIFIAVFFIASEGAQQFLGETTGSAYLGIAAAGALVFAIAPLQRVAERVAERAVPAANAGSAKQISSPREEIFRNVLRVALRDSDLTRDDETEFYRLAEELGIGAGRANEILSGIEGEREVAL